MVGKPEVIQNGVLGSLRRMSSTWTINANRKSGVLVRHLSDYLTYRKRANTPCSCLRLARSRFRYNTKTYQMG